MAVQSVIYSEIELAEKLEPYSVDGKEAGWAQCQADCSVNSMVVLKVYGSVAWKVQ